MQPWQTVQRLTLVAATLLSINACADSKPVASRAGMPVAVKAAGDTPAANHPGAKVYQSACMSCHVATGKPSIAPPIFAVKDHVIKAYPERPAFIQRVSSWVKAPNANDVLMPGAVGKFGLMSAQPQLSEADLQAVAEFLYDTDLDQPDWYSAHYQAEHGKKP